MSNKSGVSDQVLPLPSGGGAVDSIGEKFSPDLHTGTGNFTVPIAVPEGRNGFAPQLSLAYSSGNGNGPFGLGWTVAVSSVTRKTSRGVPRYDDASDVFVLSGMEDLVPVGDTRYRPRRDTAFAQIHHVQSATTDHWEARTRDGLASTYGTPEARGADPAAVSNPADRTRVFAWCLTSTVDTFGNTIRYDYTQDAAQLYLDRIRYIDVGTDAFLVEVAFVYDDRPDPFSAHRSGFEIRTRRRCSRIEVRSGGQLARVYHLRYEQPAANPLSLLAAIQIEGVDGETSQWLPPIELGYTSFDPQARVLRTVTGSLPPMSLASPVLEQADLFARGLPDVVQMDGTVARYWRNLGNGVFDRPREMSYAPSGAALGSHTVQLLDADGDGRIDLVITDDLRSGYFPLRSSGSWDQRGYRPYAVSPAISFADPDVKLVDLDGDGVIDAIRTGSAFEYYFNDPALGWARDRRVPRGTSDVFPDVSFSDAHVRLADMTGDGLQDIVLVHDRTVEYWPSLGHGNWAPRVRMERSPQLPIDYDPRRLLLGDLDGDGLADLVYVADGSITIWINHSGNAWSDPIAISGTPRVSDLDAVRLTDLLGCGTQGILWTKDLVRELDRWFFLDLTGSTKPYLLSQVANGRGVTTRIEYASSTTSYLAGAWKTSLPFPVHVVSRCEVRDAISGGTMVTEYRYHHGHWDGVEREFRGFGRVDQLDGEAFAANGSEYFSPPTETRTWFHVGPIADDAGGWYELDYSAEQYAADPAALARPGATVKLLAALPPRARHDALRCLAGEVLRVEMYARDDSPRRDRPYSVVERQLGLREEAPAVVFFPHVAAERTTLWDRGDDPMTQLRFVDDHDTFGQPRSEIVIGVPRGRDYRATGTERYLLRRQVTEYAATPGDRYIVDRVARTTAYEYPDEAGLDAAAAVHDRILAGAASAKMFAQTVNFYDGAAFDGLPAGQLGDRGALVRTEQLALTADQVTAAGAPPYLVDGTPVWTDDYPPAVRTQVPATGGYRARDAGFFAVTKSCGYDFQLGSGARGLVRATRDPLGNATMIDYDTHELLPVRITDPVGAITQTTYDDRTLKPIEVVDANDNHTVYAYSPLGFVQSIARMGKTGETVGDTRDVPGVAFVYDLTAFVDRGEPVSVRSIRRVHHALDNGIPDDERDATIEKLEYSDGFGRLIQTRTLGEDIRYGDPALGDAALDPDPTRPVTPLVRAPDGDAFVVVSGWQVFDNKGRVVETYEPFFSTGWTFSGTQPAGVKTRLYYDPRGQLVRTSCPDGSEQRAVYGVISDLTDPDTFVPSPWERHIYDQNDNAGRTHATSTGGYQSHWNTPSSTLVDGWARPVQTITRAPEDLVTRLELDVRGNVTAVIDPLGRRACTTTYDLMNRAIRVDSIDAGTRLTIQDPTGGVIEVRDGKGALVLRTYDARRRPVEMWARDLAGEAVGLRERVEYGDQLVDAKARNLVGRPVRQLDEAGTVDFERCDFKGNVIASSRRVLADELFAGTATYRVDWSTPPALDAREYRFEYAYDGLDRAISATVPGGTRTITRRYNRASLLEAVAFDGATYVSMIAYNAKGQRLLVAHGNGIMTRYQYDPQTFRTVRQRSERFTQPADHTYQPVGPAVYDVATTYDLVGNVTGMTDRTFTYDAAYRLVHATGRECTASAGDPSQPWFDAPRCQDLSVTRPYEETYHYDAAGTLRELDHQAGGTGFTRTITTSGDSNRIARLTIGTLEHQYACDPCGNVVKEDASRTFEFDHSNRMRAFREGTSLAAQYLYDSAGQRVKKIIRNGANQVSATVYIAGIFEHRRNTTASGVEENDSVHVMDDTSRVAIRRIGPALTDDPFRSLPDGVLYHLADAQRSSTVVLASSGEILNREEYTPYGETSFGSFAKKRYRFTGKERDEETGLSYHGARYYAPWRCSWCSADPAGYSVGTNLFQYVRSNPLRFTDPTGREEEPVEKPGAESEEHESTTTKVIEGAHGTATAADAFHIGTELEELFHKNWTDMFKTAEHAAEHEADQALFETFGKLLGGANIILGSMEATQGFMKARATHWNQGGSEIVNGTLVAGSGIALFFGAASAPVLSAAALGFTIGRKLDARYKLSDRIEASANREDVEARTRFDDREIADFAADKHEETLRRERYRAAYTSRLVETNQAIDAYTRARELEVANAAQQGIQLNPYDHYLQRLPELDKQLAAIDARWVPVLRANH